MPTEDVYWAILANVEQEQQRLLAEARAVEAQVRLVHFEARDRRDSSEWGSYLPYIRELASGVGCYWAVLTFYGPLTKRKMRLKEFGRRQKYRYSPSQFPKARGWEIDEIIRAENVFEKIRRRTALLGTIVQMVKGTGSAEGVVFTKEPPRDLAASTTGVYQSVLEGWQSPGRLNAVLDNES
ncbi:conjugative transfer protein MobI(A/C) [Azospirillum sp. TSH64]|uniref:conjugative transfer protein MobI(A/C) n=1 Tax=Azospirillum sp. TSH64 TaxID=652740 RepID=UPI000D60D05D|nr:conjugative transfer protein MobI(A/C) [Azospirillum sp. TSH64]PWC78167.1 hypothetical protein TSH64_28420 [Azospirillum sp. TSH64]PWC81562.1 hypothetical protein TSH64_00110 [Azospirillum sp. TSH64]